MTKIKAIITVKLTKGLFEIDRNGEIIKIKNEKDAFNKVSMEKSLYIKNPATVSIYETTPVKAIFIINLFNFGPYNVIILRKKHLFQRQLLYDLVC